MSSRPYTLVQVAQYDKELIEATWESRLDFKPMRTGLGNTIKFCSYQTQEKPYVLVVSEPLDKQPNQAYDIQLSVTSLDSPLNQQLRNELARDAGINFFDHPLKNIAAQMETGMNLAFPIFLKNPEVCMELWGVK